MSVGGVVTLTNTGGETLGIGTVAVSGEPAGYSVAWDAADVSCPADGGSATPAGELLFSIGAGCSIPLAVAFDGSGTGDVWAALGVVSIDDEAGARDPMDWTQQVYLHAKVAPTVEEDSRSRIIGEMTVTPDVGPEGEMVAVAVLVHDAHSEPPVYAWISDSLGGGTFSDPLSASTTWTCPELPDDSGGQAFNLVVQTIDPGRKPGLGVREGRGVPDRPHLLRPLSGHNPEVAASTSQM